MSDLIKLLPDSIANQIAAGEVVQRPASVVKELLENAVDAKATDIKVVIKEAGKLLIQISDNGIGMTGTDARMCFERHATSKIKTADDLFHLYSYGFRGEALASIAAVAQVEMRTKRKEDELGTLIRIEASEVKEHENTACSDGTLIQVKNLFYNVPARRNFLKSNPVELSHILDEFHRVALSYPEIAFSLFQNDLPTYQLLGGKLAQRIVGVFGNAAKERLIPVKEETDFVKIHGYVGKPESARKTRGEQFFFVNKRFVKNGYLHHALITAYEGLLQADTHPFYTIFIDIDPIHIDINVHPTKTEIKFDDERMVYAILQASIRKALNSALMSPGLNFEQPDALEAMIQQNRPVQNANKSNGSGWSPVVHFDRNQNTNTQRNLEHWQNLFQPSNRESRIQNFESQNDFQKADYQTSAPSQTQISIPASKQESIEKNTFQLHSRFIVAQVKSGMMLIDQNLAHERILFEKYLARLNGGKGFTQQLIFPQVVTLNPADFAMILEIEHEIRDLGFDFEVFGANAFIIRGIPSEVQDLPEKELFEHFLEQIKDSKAQINLPKKEMLARSLAKRSALKSGKNLSQLEMNALIDSLFACATPGFTPEGKAILTILSLDFLEKELAKGS